jgi:hypothetical protein
LSQRFPLPVISILAPPPTPPLHLAPPPMPASVRLAGSTPSLPFVPSPPPPLILGARAPPLVPTTATSTTSARPRRIQPAPVVARSSSSPPPHLRSPCAPPPPHRSALHCLGASVPVSSDGGHACQLLGFLFLAFPPVRPGPLLFFPCFFRFPPKFPPFWMHLIATHAPFHGFWLASVGACVED